ncbi:probable WRKY transcription factor 75 [Rhodamnia argentea]|uniref:Probable WRKY transcription factor 75 n=1 Tax=Rhodamnia argentea TaxID=178133 RepID=A0A8B8Q4W4_9MYRT|nr:probable WRKY transcription factor 75 [Rhodamnia argentea]
MNKHCDQPLSSSLPFMENLSYSSSSLLPCLSSPPRLSSSPPSLFSLNPKPTGSSAYSTGFEGHGDDGNERSSYLGLVMSNSSSSTDRRHVLEAPVVDKDDAENVLNTVKKKGGKKVRKPKYAFQTRSQVDILDDGYRWRKYGQKAVKHNKFPRSYYRCTYRGCNVKKQVQRLTKDEGVVVTTYEGMHSHPIEKSTENFERILSQLQIYSTSV